MTPQPSLTWIADGILLLMLLEGGALLLLRHRLGPAGPWWRMLPMLAAGACLLLALRIALAGASPAWLLTALGAALLAHLADLATRWAP